jgi:hypothetical protein
MLIFLIRIRSAAVELYVAPSAGVGSDVWTLPVNIGEVLTVVLHRSSYSLKVRDGHSTKIFQGWN